MAKSWKPKIPKAYQPYKQQNPFKPLKFEAPFKLSKEPKKEELPHAMTLYERDLIEQLCPVILNKQLIRFWYKDKTSSFEDWRLIEPHSIGQVKYKTANILLTGWFLPTSEQIMDGHTQDWKNYILDDISRLEILGQTYGTTRPGYNPNDKRMTTIYCATAQW
jgi:hypothetical protein